MIDIVIFSKNRPLQLYSFLESMEHYTDVRGSAEVSVIYKYDDEYSRSLDEIRERFSSVRFVKQGDFKSDLSSCLSGDNRFCTFFVDDIVFKRKFSFEETCTVLSSNPGILTFSMRMGLHLNFCYPTRESQPIPDGFTQQGFFIWDWKLGQGDWSYPISVDGHVFRKDDFCSWLRMIEFTNPNQLEDRLQFVKSLNFPSRCICNTASSIVNLPINRVQNEYKNRSEQVSPEVLKQHWDDRKKIDFLKLSNINNNSAHFPTKIELMERN